jgi:hypothetical protein
VAQRAPGTAAPMGTGMKKADWRPQTAGRKGFALFFFSSGLRLPFSGLPYEVNHV